MAAPKYETREHRTLRTKLGRLVAAGNAWCAETVCLEERDGRDRWIAPGTPWDVAHHDDGATYKGPAHRRCNRSDGAVRGNRMRGGIRRSGALARP